jgi:hypothetical protein
MGAPARKNGRMNNPEETQPTHAGAHIKKHAFSVGKHAFYPSENRGMEPAPDTDGAPVSDPIPREGTLVRAYTDAQQRAIDRLEAKLSEAFDRIVALENESVANGMGYRG